MNTETPTAALRLVPDNEDAPTNRKLARALSNHLEVMVVERSDPSLELTEQSLEEVIDELAAAPASPLPEGGGVPADVARLVVAARRVAFENPSQAELRELDIASEAFASRVPWDDAPDEIPAAPTGAE